MDRMRRAAEGDAPRQLEPGLPRGSEMNDDQSSMILH